jgi:hypothetical protein
MIVTTAQPQPHARALINLDIFMKASGFQGGINQSIDTGGLVYKASALRATGKPVTLKIRWLRADWEVDSHWS